MTSSILVIVVPLLAFDIIIHNIEPLTNRTVIVRWCSEVVLDLFLELGGNSYSNFIAKDLNIFLRVWCLENKVREIYEK
jgi:hypothetical protein